MKKDSRKQLRRKGSVRKHYNPDVGDINYSIDVFNRTFGHPATTSALVTTMMEQLDEDAHWYDGMTVEDKFQYLKHTFRHVNGNWAIKVPDDIMENVLQWDSVIREAFIDHPQLAANAALADGGWVVFAPTDPDTANYVDYANSSSVDEWVEYVGGGQPTEEAAKQVTDGIQHDFLVVDQFNTNITKLFDIVVSQQEE